MTPPPMSLDELRAAAERVIARPLTNVNDDDARAVATWVRDLLGAQPMRIPMRAERDRGWLVVRVGSGLWLDLDERHPTRLAADLLRAAAAAESPEGPGEGR
jgi:hypothetical protein